MAQSNVKYKLQIDDRKWFETFNVGDVILHSCSTDRFQVLKKPNYNTYVIDLLRFWYQFYIQYWRTSGLQVS